MCFRAWHCCVAAAIGNLDQTTSSVAAPLSSMANWQSIDELRILHQITTDLPRDELSRRLGLRSLAVADHDLLRCHQNTTAERLASFEQCGELSENMINVYEPFVSV